jgi:hypothetical protein
MDGTMQETLAAEIVWLRSLVAALALGGGRLGASCSCSPLVCRCGLWHWAAPTALCAYGAHAMGEEASASVENEVMHSRPSSDAEEERGKSPL